MSNYTAEEKAAFAKKDKEILKMNALNRAVDLLIAFKEPSVIDAYMDYLEGLADRIANWIAVSPEISEDKCQCVGGCRAGIEDVHFEPELPHKEYPVPSPAEMDVLLLVAKELAAQCPDGYSVDFDKVCCEVHDVFTKYPHNKNSISKVVNGINKNNVFVKGSVNG